MRHMFDELDSQFDKILGFEDEIDCAMCRDSKVAKMTQDIANNCHAFDDVVADDDIDVEYCSDTNCGYDMLEDDVEMRSDIDRELAYGDYDDDDVIEIAIQNDDL